MIMSALWHHFKPISMLFCNSLNTLKTQLLADKIEGWSVLVLGTHLVGRIQDENVYLLKFQRMAGNPCSFGEWLATLEALENGLRPLQLWRMAFNSWNYGKRFATPAALENGWHDLKIWRMVCKSWSFRAKYTPLGALKNGLQLLKLRRTVCHLWNFRE